MADTAIDLDAYFRRIGYAGPREPTVEVLAALQKHHLNAIPFENLDVLLKRPIRIDPESLQRKLVAGRRGGYCFESNGLLFHVLRALGFRNTALAARVLFERPGDLPLPPRSHMLQRVDFADGRSYLVNVAFGGQTPAGLLRFEPQVEQATARESCRLIPQGDELDLEALMGEWRLLYRIAPHPHLPVNFEQPNWHVSTHPDSYFVNNLIACIPGEGCRYTLFNNLVRKRTPDGKVEERTVTSGHELTRLLEKTFTIGLTMEERAALAQRIPA